MKLKKHQDNCQDLIKINKKRKYDKCHGAQHKLAKSMDVGFALDQNNRIVNPGSIVSFNSQVTGEVLEIHVDNYIVVSYDDVNTNEVQTRFINAKEISVLD